jgi:DNA-binding response OmpR family regulator
MTGAEVASLVERLDPDVVLLDWVMPGGGLSLARALIEEHRMAGRVIIVTGLDDDRDRGAARRAGVDTYIVKPCAPDELLAAVRSAAATSTAGDPGSGAPGRSGRPRVPLATSSSTVPARPHSRGRASRL